MEDLKKQTAIRLAQEQQQQSQKQSQRPNHGFSGNHDAKDRAARATADPRQIGSSRPDQLHFATGRPRNTVRTETAAQHFQSRESSVVPHNPNTQDGAQAISAGRYYDQSSANTIGRKKGQNRQVITPPNVAGASHNGATRSPTRYQQDQRNWYQHPAPVPTMPVLSQPPSSQVFESPSHQALHSTAKSKLPHGLTVHELKEMTKARLQAEAAERHETEKHRQIRYDNQSIPPSDLESVPREAMGNLMNSDDHRSRVVQQQSKTVSDSRGSVPSLVQVHPLSAEQHQVARHPPQVSPLPPGLQHGYNRQLNSNASPYAECRGQDIGCAVGNRNQQESKMDTWETASVHSHNSTVASEYLGSESAFSGYAPQAEEASGAPFGRSRSYPVGNGGFTGAPEMPSYENTPNSALTSPGGSFFEVTVGAAPNRKRASTLSPRPGLTLLHEDRPFFSEQELGMPTFSASSRTLPIVTGNSFSPAAQAMPTDSPNVFGGTGVIGSATNDIFNRARTSSGGAANDIFNRARTSSGGASNDIFNRARTSSGGGANDIFNRARTSSTASLPAISHTAEEFALDRNSSAAVLTNQHLIGGAPIQEEVLNSATSSVLGSPILFNGSSSDLQSAATNGISSVFRDPSSMGLSVSDHSAILGAVDISSSQQNTRMDSFSSRVGSMDSFNDARARAAWNGSGSNVFLSGSGLMDNAASEETIGGDLASILKLSGAEERTEQDEFHTLRQF